MRKTFLFVCLCLLCCTGMRDLAASSNAGVCKLNDGTIIVTWMTQDVTGPWHIWGATGLFSADPSTWIAQEITVAGATCISATPPILAINSTNGHAIATWQYFDQTANVTRVAAAVLPAGTATWTSQAISDVTSESSGSGDQTASIDSSGNIMVTWSTFNATLQMSVVRAATGTISDNVISWNTSYTLPGAGYSVAKKKK